MLHWRGPDRRRSGPHRHSNALANVTSGRLLDPDEARRRLESRPAPIRLSLRLSLGDAQEQVNGNLFQNSLNAANFPCVRGAERPALRLARA